MYSAASIKACEFRTADCFDLPLNQSIARSSEQTIRYQIRIFCDNEHSGNLLYTQGKPVPYESENCLFQCIARTVTPVTYQNCGSNHFSNYENSMSAWQ
jgi:hypothetical protein